MRLTNARRKAENRYGHSEATRAKISKATARSLAEGKVGRPSKLEDVVACELTRLGAEFTRQHAIRDDRGRFGMVLDFWLPALGVAIEVNGTYWHADPRVYSTLNSTQDRCVAAYRRKQDELRRRNIKLVEIWEMDLKADPSKTVAVAYAMAIG